MMRIGFFDSGLGGLSVLRHALARIPDASYLYVADSAYAPYGARPKDWVSDRSLLIARYLQREGADAIVIACNTATALAAERIRAELTLPVVAMEPALKPAVRSSRSGRIGVLATASTLASQRYADLKTRYASAAEVSEYAPHHWIEAIEKGEHLRPEFPASLTRDLSPMLAKGIDTWVLACTHFPIIIDQIRAVVEKNAIIIDPAAAVTAELMRRLPEAGSARDQTAGPAPMRLLTSGSCESLRNLGSAYLARRDLQVESFTPDAAR